MDASIRKIAIFVQKFGPNRMGFATITKHLNHGVVLCPKDYEDFRLFGEILYPFEAVPNDQKVEYKQATGETGKSDPSLLEARNVRPTLAENDRERLTADNNSLHNQVDQNVIFPMFTLFDNLSPAVNEKQFDSIVVKDSSILNEMK
ncbi:unnamed protein product [Dracunculus medinensis]|uniref:'chromo' domain containing protein n=1 Tax=Dracunculus medinensis TaxID=318479 RepID=A0A0N4UEB0_DRAME|nr:unnamed protein product [Dracunculus medinensis]